MKTTTVPITAPTWFILDATDAVPGRLATVVAHVLRGKHKPSFSPHQLCGDHVIVLHAEKLQIHPKKRINKLYRTHSGYLGSMRTRSLGQMMEKKPEEVVRQAVYGMLPKNRLRLQMMKRVHIFQGDAHPYAPQKPVPFNVEL
ncbi:MAG: 50S ribosomal protein L13 [Candidatus Peribacteraceae bacterium]|jgi:large subunit ribosomal protein L13